MLVRSRSRWLQRAGERARQGPTSLARRVHYGSGDQHPLFIISQNISSHLFHTFPSNKSLCKNTDHRPGLGAHPSKGRQQQTRAHNPESPGPCAPDPLTISAHNGA